MQHAATNMGLGETMRGQPDAVGGFAAFLRLRQGASARATWILEESPGGTMITVGADLECDWQVRAAFVPPRAFSLLVVGGRTFVRSGPEPGVLLNGKPIDEGCWVQVPNGARIDVGLARLEVSMGYGDTSEQLVDKIEQVEVSTRRTVASIKGTPRNAVGRTTMNLGAMPIEPIDARGEEPVVELPRQARKAPRNRTIELSLDDIYIEQQPLRTNVQPVAQETADAVPQARLLEHESGEFQVGALPRESMGPGPSLLDMDDNVAGTRRWWMYALAGVATAGAYGGWLVLLDQL